MGPRRNRRLSRDEIKAMFEILSTHIIPKAELNWDTPLDLLIAVVLSAQCTDRTVNRVTAELWQTCRTVDDYLALGADELQRRIRSIGLYRNKSKAIIGICEQLKATHGGGTPTTRSELEALPGVGRKTANVVLNVAFGQPTLAVDTHIFRVANRIGLAKAKTPLATERQLLKVVPPEHLHNAHHYLLLHGRYTCKARKPNCPSCPVYDLCTYQDKRPRPGTDGSSPAHDQ